MFTSHGTYYSGVYPLHEVASDVRSSRWIVDAIRPRGRGLTHRPQGSRMLVLCSQKPLAQARLVPPLPLHPHRTQ